MGALNRINGKRKKTKTPIYLLPLAEAKEKYCPFHGKQCPGDKCMAWEWPDLEIIERVNINCEAEYKLRHNKGCSGECGGCDCRAGWCRAI